MSDEVLNFRNPVTGEPLQVRLVDNGDGTYAIGAVPDPVDTATVSKVDSSASSQPALAANLVRKGVTGVNTDANACYLKYGTTASLTSFTVRIPANGYWEMPQPIYRGAMDVIWAADGAGSLVLTEF